MVGAELLAAVDEGDAAGEGVERQRPVEGRVAAADDHDVAALVAGEVGHEVDHALAGEVRGGREGPGGEAAEAAGDDDRAAPEAGAVVEVEHGRAVEVGEPLGPAAEEVRGREGGGLADQVVDQVAALDLGEAADVVDELLGVHGGDLAAGLGQGVGDHCRQAPESGVVGGVEAGRPGADDREVD